MPVPDTEMGPRLADSFDWLREYDGEPFDAIVTDPPYGLKFMGKAWDDFGMPLGYQRWSQAWAELALEVVKPGSHMVVFGAPRLYHRMAVGIEDAGWEIRDSLMWLFGQGFPKSLNLAGEDASERGLVEARCNCGYSARVEFEPDRDGSTRCPDCGRKPRQNGNNGYGTALKPGYEPIVLARAPFAGTVQGNYDAHGTGALHIDAARIPLNGDQPIATIGEKSIPDGHSFGQRHGGRDDSDVRDVGRWPANIALDEDAAAMLDAKFDASPAPRLVSGTYPCGDDSISAYADGLNGSITADAARRSNARAEREGGATGPSRFFYTAKASRSEREAGLRSGEVRRDDGRETDSDHPRLRATSRRNHHPSVKPVDLMRWLCRLVVPTGGRILDPFAGSGSTLIAAHQEGMSAVGLERDPEYVDIARGRIAHHCAQSVMKLGAALEGR